jgi:hypothetical protein
MDLSQKITKASVASLLAAVLVIASLASIGMMQTNAAARNIVFKEKFRGLDVVAQKTIEEGNIRTIYTAEAFTNIFGEQEICLDILKEDTSTDTFVSDIFGCGPADVLTVSKSLDSATFSGTDITVTDFFTDEEFTVTVHADMTATGKPQTSTFGVHSTTSESKLIFNQHGKVRPATGSLDITGDITFSTNDATGLIGDVTSGFIQVERL